MFYKTITIALALIIFLLPSSAVYAQEELIFAIDLIRHGDRTPVQEIPKSLHRWKEGLGELTNIGMKQELQLGNNQRRKYVNQYHLLPENYDGKTMYVRSTEVHRAEQSAHFFLLGLYPLNKRKQLNGTHQVIPVQVVPKRQDNLLFVKPSTNIFSLIHLYFLYNKMWQEKTINLHNKLKKWSEITGLPLNNFRQLDTLGDNLFIRQLHHINLPPGLSNKDANEIISLGRGGFVNYFRLKEVTSPLGPQFIKTMDAYLENAAHNNEDLKYVLFVAHDSTIMSVMTTLGLPLDQQPPYASLLNFSLFKNKEKYYFTTTYNHKPVIIPACGSNTCTLAQFHKFMETI